MILLQKILARWYYRILFFVLFCIVYYLLGVFTSPNSILIHQELMALYILCVSFLIEGLRANSKITNIGFTLSTHSIYEFIYGTLYALIPLLIIVCIAYLLGATVRIQENIDWASLYSTFGVMLFVAMFEEILFRGIIFQSLHERLGSITASLILSLFFGLAHLLNPNISLLPILNVVLAGIVLSSMYIATKNLWMSLAFHFVWNFTLGSVFNSPVSGIQKSGTSLLLIDWEKINVLYPFLFGGSFGLEGGFITTGLLIILSIFVLRYNTPSPYTVANLYRRYFAEQQLLSKNEMLQ